MKAERQEKEAKEGETYHHCSHWMMGLFTSDNNDTLLTLAVIGASRHDATILGRVTSRHASHVMTRHRLALLHPLFTKRF